MNQEVAANKMGTEAVPKVMLSMGIPIILSMVLQACYNIVDSMFVARIPDSGNITNMGEYAVNALTLAFPVQMLIVAFGIFYKIQQFIFFAGFGLRDAITPIVSFNYGMGDKKRVKQGIFYGILYTEIIMLIGMIGLEVFARPLIGLLRQAFCLQAEISRYKVYFRRWAAD